MKLFRLLSLSIGIFLLASGSVAARNSSAFSPLVDDIDQYLPPLYTLIDSALQNNPNIQYRDLQLIVENCKLQASKIEWTRYLGVQADIRYGTFDNYSTNSSTGQTPSTFATTSNELRWGGATFINLPLYNFLNRKNQIKMSKAELEQAKKMAEAQRKEIRELVIRQYNELLLKQRLLKVKAKFRETSAINMQITEKSFSDGRIPMSEYAVISESFTRAETEYVIAFSDFQTAYMILEEVTGMKFNLTNTSIPLHETN